jgi:hypothetical protein
MSESFIQVAMGDAPEEGLAEEGRYDLRVVNKNLKDSKSGDRKVLHLTIMVEDVADVAPMMHFLTFPNKKDWDDEPDMAKNFIRRVKRFCELFGVAWQADGFDADALDGATAESVLVKIEVGDDNTERNIIVVPRIDAGS